MNRRQQPRKEATVLAVATSSSQAVQPLDRVTITASSKGVISVCDGLGREYVRRRAAKRIRFTVAGSLGNHVVRLECPDGRVVESTSFRVDCQTRIDDAGGRFGRLLQMLYWTMAKWGEGNSMVWWNGKFYHYFVCWLRDHVHTMKGMKYFASELKSAIDLYKESQREDGMIWDSIHPRSPHYGYWDWQFTRGGFIRPIENRTWEFKRIPVENDVEYLFVEGLYYTWKATGNDAWMASCLDAAIKAFRYSTTSPYRWSKRYQLLKRGFTIDTWDFQSDEDTAISGNTMVIDHARRQYRLRCRMPLPGRDAGTRGPQGGGHPVPPPRPTDQAAAR
jgi:hypothetical protein